MASCMKGVEEVKLKSGLGNVYDVSLACQKK